MAEKEKRMEEIYRQYRNNIYHLCLLYLKDLQRAEDAMQDSFLRAWHSMQQFEGRNGCSEKTWLMRIAMNVCRDYRRSRWFRHIDLSRALDELPVHLTAVLPEDRLLMLDILRLPARYKQVLLLYYYQNMTLEEIAETLQMSRSTVHHRLKKAEALLKTTLTGGDIDEK